MAHSFWSDLISFSLAFLSHWQSYATGGIVTGLIGVVERLSAKQLSKKAYAAVFIAAFSYAACFMAWRDEFRRADALRDANIALQTQLDAAKNQRSEAFPSSMQKGGPRIVILRNGHPLEGQTILLPVAQPFFVIGQLQEKNTGNEKTAIAPTVRLYFEKSFSSGYPENGWWQIMQSDDRAYTLAAYWACDRPISAGETWQIPEKSGQIRGDSSSEFVSGVKMTVYYGDSSASARFKIMRKAK